MCDWRMIPLIFSFPFSLLSKGANLLQQICCSSNYPLQSTPSPIALSRLPSSRSTFRCVPGITYPYVVAKKFHPFFFCPILVLMMQKAMVICNQLYAEFVRDQGDAYHRVRILALKAEVFAVCNTDRCLSDPILTVWVRNPAGPSEAFRSQSVPLRWPGKRGSCPCSSRLSTSSPAS